jgi:predicted ArsR family transcriptional regulator
MDSVPPIRRKAYEAVKAVEPAVMNTSAVAKALELPSVTVRRALEDLMAYGLMECSKGGQGTPDQWSAKDL